MLYMNLVLLFNLLVRKLDLGGKDFILSWFQFLRQVGDEQANLVAVFWGVSKPVAFQQTLVVFDTR